MAHHNFEPDLDARHRLTDLHLGATGQYPNGRYGERDEGEIKFAVAADKANGIVLIEFGKPVHSFGMTPAQASELADMLHQKSFECRGIV